MTYFKECLHYDNVFLPLLSTLEKGFGAVVVESENARTESGYISQFSEHLILPTSGESGLFTLKRTNPVPIIRELCWFLSGSTKVADLGSKIWDEWVKDDGTIGPMYGKQYRNIKDNKTGETIDQLKNLVKGLVNNPNSRRHVISLYNVADLSDMALHPCHGLVIQFFSAGEYLHIQVYQRSADLLLGLPFNIASYNLLLKLIARETNHLPGILYYTLGDYHVYLNQVDQINNWIDSVNNTDQKTIESLSQGDWVIDPDFDLFDPDPNLIKVEGYVSLPYFQLAVNV